MNDERIAKDENAVDYFAVLNEERRPWLDLDALKQKYQKLTLALHPDVRLESRETGDFTSVTEAHRVLSDPRLRLRHLLQLEGVEPGDKKRVPDDIAELFPAVAKVVQEADALLTKSAAASNALSKSLLRAEAAKQHTALKATLTDLQQLESKSLGELRDLNDSWHHDRRATLGRLQEIQQSLAYAGTVA